MLNNKNCGLSYIPENLNTGIPVFLKQCTNRVKDTQRQHVVGPAVSWVELEFGGVKRGHPALLQGVATWVL